jgi:hypothetical protein
MLGAEHAAVYGYGLLGGRLTHSEETLATGAFATHESRRDVVMRLIRDNGGTPVAALPAYRPRVTVVDRRTALQLATSLEEDCAAACTRVIGATDDPTLRRTAAGWLADIAVRDAVWRSRIGPVALAANPPLPGLVAPPAASPTPTDSSG